MREGRRGESGEERGWGREGGEGEGRRGKSEGGGERVGEGRRGESEGKKGSEKQKEGEGREHTN